MGARGRGRGAAALALGLGLGLALGGLPGAQAGRALRQAGPSETVAAHLASVGLSWGDVPAEIQNLPPAALEDWAALVAESYAGAPNSGGMSFGGAPATPGGSAPGELDLSALQAFMPEGVNLEALQALMPADWTALNPLFGVQTGGGGWQDWGALFPGTGAGEGGLGGLDWSQFMPPAAEGATEAFSNFIGILENFANQSTAQATAGISDIGDLIDQSLDFILSAQSQADELVVDLLPLGANTTGDGVSEAKSNAVDATPKSLGDAFYKMGQAQDVGSYMKSWEGLTKLMHAQGEQMLDIGLSSAQQQMIFDSVDAFRKQFPAVLLNPSVANYLLWARGPDWKVHHRLIKLWKISSWVSGYVQGLKFGGSPVGLATTWASKALAKTALPQVAASFPGGFPGGFPL